MRSGSVGLMLGFAFALPICAQVQGGSAAPTDNPTLRQERPVGGQGSARVESRTSAQRGRAACTHEAERAAYWKVVQVPFNKAGLTVREQQMVAKLADAAV